MVWLVAPDASVILNVKVGVAGAMAEQEKLIVFLFPLAEFETLMQVPLVVERYQLVISAPPSASSA